MKIFPSIATKVQRVKIFFVFLSKSESNGNKIDDDEVFDFYVTFDKGIWYVGLGYQDYHKEFQYIHQLQNFYFFLKDKEL